MNCYFNWLGTYVCHGVKTHFIQEISAKGKGRKKSQAIDKPVDSEVTTFEKVKKDLNALSNEEQMDVVYRYVFFAFLSV